MTIDEVKIRKLELEKKRDNLKDEEEKLIVEISTLKAQVDLKQNKVFESEGKQAFIENELTKINNVIEILNIKIDDFEIPKKKEEQETPLQKYSEFIPSKNYEKGDKFRVENRVYEVILKHKSDNHFNSLLTNKYQLIDADTLKPIFNYSITKIYMKNDKVLYDDVIYVSKIDNNNLSPKSNVENWLKLDI